MFLSEHIMFAQSGVRTHASEILDLKSSALDHSAICAVIAPKGNRTPSSTLEGLRVTTTLLALRIKSFLC